MKVIVVIPAYNEEKIISGVLEACGKKGLKDIIVVDDGSTDNTAKLAYQQGVLVVSHLINRGVGAATQTGLDAAKTLGADMVVTMDADGQHKAEDVLYLIQTMKKRKVDIVIGSRFLGENNIPPLRRIFNRIANVLTFLLSGISTSDSQSGLKAFSKNALQKIIITANGYEFCSEIFREAFYYHLSIVEVPISVAYTAYSLSKGQSFSTGISTVLRLIIRSLMR